ncbi:MULTISPECIES: calcium-binding protein [unclassified Microcoleus]|uniref:calcium-binding protein n=1 Tax=unclassified Microcoleus TaxID=2642155 RepID=UPI001D392EA7|nr:MULTISPECIES: calcium-binding protein [unclassified Microcoleus]MCC3503932.1 hypothetical protein [Microcoleus sp. PH2017_19_SFW_U_A]MCC3521538.1 hypothetical protein [Microcoleus sp. PH2017_20_SFW_D_A]MCC3552551.1 hypothetical protein [Microcoleus sp. PH2017_35_SFW_U_B]TAG85163.1 MAG: calcium-binding protein [Oscillatoriales cyanobacterium]
MPDNLALLDKNDDILNGSSTKDREDCGCGSKKAATQETLSNSQNIQNIFSLGSNDTLESSVTQDFLNGNTGNDFISGSADGDIGRSTSQVGSGSLSIDGSAYILTEGSDTFTIPLGLLDTLLGGLRGLGGADSITGSESGDIVYGDEGNDRIEGRGGADLLKGGAGNDFLNGNQGNDNLSGGEGNDTIYGGKGDDLIDGGNGDDVLYGDFGIDTLTGSTGQDIFVLPSGSAAITTSAADIITDFNKGDDFIGLTDGLTEAGVTLEAASIVPGSSDTVIKNSATGAILGRVAGVSPTDVRGRLVKANIVTYDIPKARQISADTYEMTLAGSDGSQFVSTIKKTDTQVYQESVRYTPSNQGNSGLQPFTVRYNPDGTRGELQKAGSSNSVILQRIDNKSGSVIEKSATGETEVGKIGDFGTDFARNLALEISCIFGKGFCDAFEQTADMVSKWKDGAAKVGSVLEKFRLPVNGSSSAIEEFEVISQTSGVICTALFGNDEALKKAVTGAAEDKIPLPGPLTKLLKIGDSVQNLFSGINKFFFDGKGELSSNLRKELGINACDPQSPTVPPPPSTNPSPPAPATASLKIEIKPSAIPYLGTANLNVKYSNPANDSRIVEITGSGQKGLGSTSFLIPEDKKGQGELNFTLTNRGRELGGPGSESLDNFLDVGIGNGRGGGLFANDYKQLSFDLLGAPNPLDFLENVYTVTSVEGLTRR